MLQLEQIGPLVVDAERFIKLYQLLPFVILFLHFCISCHYLQFALKGRQFIFGCIDTL